MSNKYMIGQEVVIDEGFGSYRIDTVMSVSPTGIITLKSGRKFNADGVERGVKPARFSRRSELTNKDPKEIRREFRRVELLNRIENAVRHSKASLEPVEEAARLLGIETK